MVSTSVCVLYAVAVVDNCYMIVTAPYTVGKNTVSMFTASNVS